MTQLPLVDPLPAHRLRLSEIIRARSLIDPVFLDTPQFECEPLNDVFGCRLTLKVETLNPIRSFKGRGASFLIRNLAARFPDDPRPIVGASAGNWGQAVAYACRSIGKPLILYASVNANPLKIERMRALGAEVRLTGVDFDAAKIEAQAFAAAGGGRMVADGLDVEASEGAGTMAMELIARDGPFDVVLVPLGNGAMLTGIARWLKAAAPHTRVIGVSSAGADAMEKSWRHGALVFPDSVATIADGIGIRVPIPEAVADMRGLVDDVLLVEDAAILDAMRLAHRHTGLVLEPSGAAGMAALVADPSRFAGQRLATILCGGNLTEAQIREWLFP
jgi:threonine dehydratase